MSREDQHRIDKTHTAKGDGSAEIHNEIMACMNKKHPNINRETLVSKMPTLMPMQKNLSL